MSNHKQDSPESAAASSTLTGDAKSPNAFTLDASRNFRLWVGENRCSLAFSTYQHGALFLIGLDQTGRLTQSVHRFSRCMGLYVDEKKIWASSLHQLWRFSHSASDTLKDQGVDRVYRPRVSYITGDMDIHEMSEDASGRLIFVNTLFSCLGTPSHERSFEPVWKPSFISRLVPEDRCHLNGLAMRDGKPSVVSALARSDIVNGWRDHRRTGGLLLDVSTSEVLAEGLCMPHSPRWAFGKLWVLNSGEGTFGTVDTATGKFNEITFCPGYARGLSFIGKYAVIGLSKPRTNGAFGNLPLQEKLTHYRAEARCGLIVVDIEKGSIVEWLNISGAITELFDVSAIHNVRRPIVMGDPTRSRYELISY